MNLELLLLLTAAGLSQPDCAAIPARSSLSPVVVGDGAPGSATRAAIQAALDGGGHIEIDQGPAPSTIAIDRTLVATGEATLDGRGLVTLDGLASRRILRIDNPINAGFRVTLQNLTLTRGSTPSSSGAAIARTVDGPLSGPWQVIDLELINVDLIDNHAIAVEQDGGGGGIYATGFNRVLMTGVRFAANSGSNGGAFYSLGSREVRITDSVLENNTATGNGGNPGNGGNGGAIGIDGGNRRFILCRSEIRDNTSNAHGAGFFSVMYDTTSLTAFVDSNIEGNRNISVDKIGGGLYIQGGPFLIERSALLSNEGPGGGGMFLGPNANGAIVNTTFHGNMATEGLGGALFVNDPSIALDLRHATIVNNTAPGPVNFAGGIQVGANNNVTMSNTILANNTGGNEFNPWNIRNPVGDGGGNLQWPARRPSNQLEVPATATVVFADPLLGPLDDNGGPTRTAFPMLGSPAIDAGNPAHSDPVDQRGVARDGSPDIGAVEDDGDRIFLDGYESAMQPPDR